MEKEQAGLKVGLETARKRIDELAEKEKKKRAGLESAEAKPAKLGNHVPPGNCRN